MQKEIKITRLGKLLNIKGESKLVDIDVSIDPLWAKISVQHWPETWLGEGKYQHFLSINEYPFRFKEFTQIVVDGKPINDRDEFYRLINELFPIKST